MIPSRAIKPLVGLWTVLLLAGVARSDVLINEHFDQDVPDNSPVGSAAGWHACALFNGVVTDYTHATPGANFPSLSHLPPGAGTNGVGYLVMGAGNVVSNVLVWLDTATRLNGCTVTNLSFYTKNNSAASTEQIVVRIAGQWYASAQAFADLTGNSYWAPTNFTFTQAAAAWRFFHTNTLTLGAALSTPLPGSPVTAVGLFGLISGTGKIRVDELVVAGASDSVPPAVAQPVAWPASAVPAPASIRLGASAAGSPPLDYQWRKAGANLSDGTTGYGSHVNGSRTASLTISNTHVLDSGGYDVVVGNAFGVITSAVLTVSITNLIGPLIRESFNESRLDPGVISQAPGWHARAGSAGTIVDYSTTPDPPVNANYPNLSLSASADGNSPGYLVLGQNETVNPVLVWMDTSAMFRDYTLEEAAFYSRNNSAASTMQIAVGIGGQWYLSTRIFTDTTGGATPWAFHHFQFTSDGAAWRHFDTNTLTAGGLLANPLPAGDVLGIGVFGVIASNVTGKIRIDEFTVDGFRSGAPPVVAAPTADPDTNAFEGATVRLSVTARGAPPLAYQWRRNGVNLTNGPALSGATSSRLTLSNVTLADSGIYDVAVGNSNGLTVSPPLALSVVPQLPVGVNWSAYDAESRVVIVQPDTNTLKVTWSDRGGCRYQAEFNLRSGQRLLRSLEVASPGSPFLPIGREVDPRYRVTLGTRHPQIGWPYIFFDRVDANTPPPVAHLSSLNVSNVQVVSESPHRVKLVFSPLQLGPYSGDLTCCIYDGSPFLQFQASMLVDQPWVAYTYDALFYADYAEVAFKNNSSAFQTVPAASLTQATPGENARLVARHRAVLGTLAGGNGALAVMAPPHTCIYPTDQSDNFGYVQAGQGFIGTRMTFSADGRYRPWVDAPQGATQRMDVFLVMNSSNAQAALTSVLAYTHGDSYKPLPGYYTMAEHFHPEFTWNDLGGQDTLTPFKQTMQALGVQIVQPMEFHGPGHPFNNTSDRLAELDRMFNLLEANSDDAFLLIPGEEYNHWFGGHWSYLFPRRVYFTGWSGQGSLAFKLTNVVSGGVSYPTVYQVGDAEHMLRLLREEGGLAWSSHPRIKDTQQQPDALVGSEFYRDDAYLAGDWKAMPLDLSRDRLGFRSLQLMDETAQWGYRKSMLGEVDTFLLDPTHEIYAHMNVNYLKLAAFPPKTNWSSVVNCIRNGEFFTTTGEVLIHSWSASRTGVTATVEWYFPPAFAEVVWGQADGVRRQKLSLTDEREFSTKLLAIPVDLSAANWVRLEVWDVARNGAFTQPFWLNPPANPALVAGEVLGFTLINTDTDSPVPGYDPIPNQAILQRSKLPPNLTIRANISPLVMDRVTISLDGVNASRTQWPYCLTACTVSPGLRGCPFYDYSPSVLTTGSHTITATPWRDTTAGASLSLTFSVVDSMPPPGAGFAMDGLVESAGYQIATNGGLYAAVKGTTLYVAAPASDSNDLFILVTDNPAPLTPAPWNKAGMVAFDVHSKPFLAQNGASRVVSWNHGDIAAACPPSVGLGWVEGALDLAEVFTPLPATVAIAVARYAPGTGGALIPDSQVPSGNGNPTVESEEFLVIPLAAIRDENSDGVLDVLESNPGFPASFTKNPGVFVVRWPAVPGRTYRVISCDGLRQPMLPLSAPIHAGEGTFNLSYTDYPPAAVSQRFYRVLILPSAR